MVRQLAGVLLSLICSAAGALLRAQASGEPVCSSCHDQGPKLQKSAHANLACATCHVKHEEYPHPKNAGRPACTTCHQGEAKDYVLGVHGQAAKRGNSAAPDCAICHGGAHELLKPKATEFRKAMLETCGMCHAEVVQQFKNSVHGHALEKGVLQAPLCTDCHGEHSIQKHTSQASPVSPGHIRETCGTCHGNVRLSRRFGIPADRIISFDASYHGLAAKSGSQTVANCASCHGVHNILSSSDATSTIHAKNLPQTCGKCHEGAGKRFAISPIHVVEGRTGPVAVRWVRRFYLALIPLLIGLMLLHNGGDWVRKVARMRFGAAKRHRVITDEYTPEVRMLDFERLQHMLLVISFAVLVWTGFALKYPDQWWARPLLLWEGSHSWRSWIHRGAGVVFILVCVLHAISLMLSPRLRTHWKQLLPKANDVPEALQNLAYNLGLRSSQPARSSHSYIEKAEYWAVVWGAVIMIASGIMLWANNLMLSLFPKSWLDLATTVHFYEAVLATLAIVVWHFYSVILDPEVYPMDTAWFTGISVKKHEIHQSEDAAQATVTGRPL